MSNFRFTVGLQKVPFKSWYLYDEQGAYVEGSYYYAHIRKYRNSKRYVIWVKGQSSLGFKTFKEAEAYVLALLALKEIIVHG
jgi:hypothetical protein